MKKNSIKNTRINQEVQRELGMLISQELKDPRVNPMTTVVACEVAPDLKTAKVYISVLGDEQSQKDTLVGLKSAAPFLRSELAHRINLRNTPELRFIGDQSIDMSKLIDDVNANLREGGDDEINPDSRDDGEGESEEE